MQILLEILYALIEGVIYEALAYFPKKIYRVLMVLIYGRTFKESPKSLHWLARYTVGISAVLLTIGAIAFLIFAMLGLFRG
jgi:hypothetical protein